MTSAVEAILAVLLLVVQLEMGTRGRGRGSGRGRGMSFSVEALGFGMGEALPGPVLAPPSLFPALLNPPVGLRAENKQNSSFSGCVDWDYCVMVKKSMIDWLWDSSPYSGLLGDSGRSSAHLSDVERYSDRYQFAQASSSQKDTKCFQWTRLPKELSRRKGEGKNKTSGKRKRKEVTEGVAKEDITKRLAELEEKEMEGVEEVKEGEGRGGEEEEGEEKEEEGEEEEEEDEDEEMDAGTDYISSYFDNGEGYLDDDDDADDGPTY